MNHVPLRATGRERPAMAHLIATLACAATLYVPSTHGATVIRGTSASDVIDVSSAAVPYEIYGIGGADTLRGSQAADLLDGGAGNDRIEGNDGDDVLVGGGGNDTLIGGSGGDTFRVSLSSSGFDVFDGGTDFDSIRGVTGDDTIGVRSISGIELIDGGPGRDTLKMQDAAGLTLDLSNVSVIGVEIISGGSAADLIVGSAGDDTLRGGGGNDQIHGGPGVDRVVYSGPVNAYQVSSNSSTITVRAISGTDGTDTLATVELVEFADGCYQQAVFHADCGAAADDALLPLLQAAPEGAWIKANLNEFHEVWTPPDRRPATGSYVNPARVIFAWSSMAWDSNRAQLIFWGGGHANYSGNEIYRFDVRARRWQRASLPSDVHAPLGDAQYFAVDGPFNAPIAAHTYDNQEFLPIIDRFITFGGAKFNRANRFVLLDGSTATGPYLWDPSRAGADMVGGTAGSQVRPAVYPDVLGGQMWQNRNTVVQTGIGAARPTVFWNGTSAYAPLNGKDSLFVSETPSNGGRLFRYTISDVAKPELDTWQLIGIKGPAGFSGQGAGAYDPVRGLFARTAQTPVGPALTVWNVNVPGPDNRSYNVMPLAADGTFSVSDRQGMDYDPVRSAFVLWDGGPDVWYVRPGAPPNSGVWTATRGLRAGTAAPQRSDGRLFASGGAILEPHGILGKWKYSTAYDVFFGVQNPVSGDVWVYKPENWNPLVLDNDSDNISEVGFANTTQTVGESGGSVTLNTVRSGPVDRAVSVRYATSSGSATAGADFTNASGTVNWGVGNGGPRMIAIKITNDGNDEDDETFAVTLSNPSSGASVGPNSTVIVTVVDDDGGGGDGSGGIAGGGSGGGTVGGSSGGSGGGALDWLVVLFLAPLAFGSRLCVASSSAFLR